MVPEVEQLDQVEQILADLDRIARLPLARSETAPAAAYTSPEFFAWETTHVFAADWMCVAHASQLPGPGDFVNVDLLGEPLTVVRDQRGVIRVLSRVCPHRGMDITPEGFGHPACGNARRFVCPYHHWSFDLDGRLNGCSQMQLAEGFRHDEQRLLELRSEVWEGFVFVNLSAKASPLAEQLAELRPEVAPWRLGEMRVAIELEWDCPFNWKVMVENWMESYHHLGIHNRTLQPMMPAKDTWTESERAHFIRAHLPLKPALVDEIRQAESEGRRLLPGFRPLLGLSDAQRFEWGLHLGLPCFMFLVTSDRAIWYRLLPIAADRCRLLTTTLVAPAAVEDPAWEAQLASETEMLRAFHLEDMQVCTAMQRGLRSASYRRGRLSHLEMPVWLIQRYVAARGRGTWPTRDLPAAAGQRPE
jgi:phenylpropionate dioxygenase-like ring-hydroxylating dioxygenase large terminal subunit